MPQPKKLFCKRGHERIPENVNNDRSCKICRSAQVHEWMVENRDRKLAINRKSAGKNAGKYKATRKAWRDNNPDKIILYSKNMVENITDSYIELHVLKAKAGTVPQEVVELSRDLIILKRELKKCKESRPLMTSV